MSIIILALLFCLASSSSGKTTIGTLIKIIPKLNSCKASCSWRGKASVSQPVQTCAKNGSTFQSSPNQGSVCDGGSAYMCNNNQP